MCIKVDMLSTQTNEGQDQTQYLNVCYQVSNEQQQHKNLFKNNHNTTMSLCHVYLANVVVVVVFYDTF